MDTIVLKFGGSSVSDNIKLNIVADKIKEFYKENNVVVVVSAQGKTTDNLLREAHELSNVPNERELDTLLSSGEQISMSKLSILLNRLGYPAISLTGWQAGIVTDSNYTEAKIQDIYPKMIWNELENNDVVVVTGFQGINENNNITTLGRNGSDTTAIAIAAALEQDECYIFTDTNGVYDKDPYKYKNAKKLDYISYEDMEGMAKNGAKVLHDRCVVLAKKYGVKIIVKNTFNDEIGTIVGK